MFYPKMFSYFPISVQCWPSNFWWRIISLILLIPSYTTPQNYLYLRIICMLFNLYQNLFDLLLTGSIQHFTFKLHLLLVSCSFVLAQLQMKRACFIWYFLHMSNFHKNCGNCFFPIQQPNVFAYLEKLTHMIISSQTAIIQVTNNQLSSNIFNSFNLHRTRYQFLSNHQTIKLSFNWSM